MGASAGGDGVASKVHAAAAGKPVSHAASPTVAPAEKAPPPPQNVTAPSAPPAAPAVVPVPAVVANPVAPAPVSAPPAAANANCAQKFYFDAQGNKHFKPECFH
jgi:hypothetical protein